MEAATSRSVDLLHADATHLKYSACSYAADRLTPQLHTHTWTTSCYNKASVSQLSSNLYCIEFQINDCNGTNTFSAAAAAADFELCKSDSKNNSDSGALWSSAGGLQLVHCSDGR